MSLPPLSSNAPKSWSALSTPASPGQKESDLTLCGNEIYFRKAQATEKPVKVIFGICAGLCEDAVFQGSLFDLFLRHAARLGFQVDIPMCQQAGFPVIDIRLLIIQCSHENLGVWQAYIEHAMLQPKVFRGKL